MGYLRGRVAPGNPSAGYNLRGSKPTKNATRKPTLKNKVDRLERSVAKLKPELQEYDVDRQLTSAVVFNNNDDFDISDSLKDNASFRDWVTGDKWVNKLLTMQFTSLSAGISRVRVIVYTPKRAGNIGYSNGTNVFTHQPDMTAFKVYYDNTFIPNSSASFLHEKIEVPIRSVTSYNSEDDILDRNNIRIVFLWSSTAAGANLEYTANLYYHNK